MNQKLTKVAAVLSLVIGLMALVAGGQVLLGQAKDYYVIDWLPYYNFFAGLAAVVLAAPLFWRQHPHSRLLAGLLLGAHAFVMLILLGAYRTVVAPDSLQAMIIRITVWLIITGLLVVAHRRPQGFSASS